MTGSDPSGAGGYVASPRPTFDEPTVIRADAAVQHTWGDETSGTVLDRIYASSSKIHHIIYELAPHGAFTHSDAFRTIFAAHEVMFVLSGELALANPETGEVVRALPGEAVAFGPDTWHHGFNESGVPLRVLEFFAPPPSTGTSGAYARTKPLLQHTDYTRDHMLTAWPGEAPTATIRVVRESDYLWRLEGGAHRTLFGVIASSPDLTVGKLFLPPDRVTETRRHGGDLSLLVVDGVVSAHVADGVAPVDLRSNDGLFVPETYPYRLENRSSRSASVVCGVAPRYLP